MKYSLLVGDVTATPGNVRINKRDQIHAYAPDSNSADQTIYHYDYDTQGLIGGRLKQNASPKKLESGELTINKIHLTQ